MMCIQSFTLHSLQNSSPTVISATALRWPLVLWGTFPPYSEPESVVGRHPLLNSEPCLPNLRMSPSARGSGCGPSPLPPAAPLSQSPGLHPYGIRERRCCCRRRWPVFACLLVSLIGDECEGQIRIVLYWERDTRTLQVQHA